MVTVCPANCKTCQLVKDVMECTKCKATYIKNSAECSACPKDCVQCDYDNKGSMVCTKCAAKKALVDEACQSEYELIHSIITETYSDLFLAMSVLTYFCIQS